MKTHVTLFSNVKTKNGVPSEGDWDTLIDGVLAPMKDPPAFELWSPADLKDDRRLAENVAHVFALVLDFDGKHNDPEWIERENKRKLSENPDAKLLKVAKGEAVKIEEALERWGGYRSFWHVSKSHNEKHHSFRLVIPLPEPVSAEDYDILISAAYARELAICPESSIDTVTRDPARIWFLPPNGTEWNKIDGKHLTTEEWNSWRQISEETPLFETAPDGNFNPLESGPDGENESRIAAYLGGMPPAIAGDGGSTATFNAARKVRDLGVEDPIRIAELLDLYYNPKCSPPWTREELLHKANEAIKSKVRNPVADPTPPSAPKAGPTGYKPRPATDVYGKLLTDKDGKTLNKIINYNWLIHQTFAASIRHDEFTYKNRVVVTLPWGKPAPRDLTDHDGMMMCCWLEVVHHMAASPDKAYAAILAVAHENSFDSYRDHMNALPAWDGIYRLDDWLTTYLGADSSAYTKKVGRAFLIAMVARAMTRGGVEVHNILVLEGSQGIGKSRAARAIAGNGEWFSSAIPDLQSKDAAISIQGKAVVELAELAAMKRSNNESAKEFISRKTDKFRPPYGRAEISRDRRCVFIATTNHTNYLTDETGNRRYWPVRCSMKADPDLLARERNQLISEAKVAFEKGEKWYGDDIDAAAFSQQRSRTESDPWDDELDSYITNSVRGFSCPPSLGDFISTGELLSKFGVDMDKRNTNSAQRIARMMRSRGWADYQTQVRIGTKRKKARGYSLSKEQKNKMIKIMEQQNNDEAMSGSAYDANADHTDAVSESVEELQLPLDIPRIGDKFNPQDG